MLFINFGWLFFLVFFIFVLLKYVKFKLLKVYIFLILENMLSYFLNFFMIFL